MRDPSGEEKGGPGLSQIERIKFHFGKKSARMVEGHDDHDQAAQRIDRLETRAESDRFGRAGGQGWDRVDASGYRHSLLINEVTGCGRPTPGWPQSWS